MKSFEQIARSMYEAYRLYIQISIGVNVPSWDSPFMYEKKAWIAAAKDAHKEIFEKWVIAFGETDRGSRARAAKELRRLHARVEELEAFAKEIEQYGILLRAGGAAPQDLEDLSAALAQCVELAQGVLK